MDFPMQICGRERRAQASKRDTDLGMFEVCRGRKYVEILINEEAKA